MDMATSHIPDTPNTFPRFPDFPQEIRELIWDAAVRPVPGPRHLHRFIIVDGYVNRGNVARTVSGDFLLFGADGIINSGFSLLVPQDTPENGRNDSVYMTDSGLWMACRESRAAMERHFKKNEWWSNVKAPKRPPHRGKRGDYFGEEDASHTATYTERRTGQDKHITFYPNRDMILLQPLAINSVDWFHHYAWNDVPLIDYRSRRDAKPEPAFLGMDLAFEYHPAMYDVLVDRMMNHCRHNSPQISTMSLIDMVDLFYEDALRTMWFIDYRLRRRRETTNTTTTTTTAGSTAAGDGERAIFRSEDYIFTEILRDDMQHWELSGENEIEGEERKTTFDFFDVLFGGVSPRLELDPIGRIKVLACEIAPGSLGPPIETKYANGPCNYCLEEEAEEKRPKRPLQKASQEDDDLLEEIANLNLFG